MTKAEILQTIRDTAAKNAGAPFGQKRFTSETGIPIHAWRGKYWLRWSQALSEAGFTPHDFTEGFDDDILLGKLASLARSAGHFPTYPELVLARRGDSTVPNAHAFERLGSKPERIEKLRVFIAKTPEFSDVLALLPEPTAPKESEASTEDELEGFVYMVRLGRHFKIGRTTAVPRRHREIALELPETPTVVHTIRTDDPEGIERYWHGRFAKFQTNGEWFALTPKEVRIFKRRRAM